MVQMVMLVMLLIVFGTATQSQAKEPMPSDSSAASEKIARVVKGDVLTIEGEYYVVKDITGHEVRLHVDRDTKNESHLKVKVGDKIEAHVAPDGHVQSISLQTPDAGKPAGPQG
jgi:hypothetical protein